MSATLMMDSNKAQKECNLKWSQLNHI
jgi:hypothetical protein